MLTGKTIGELTFLESPTPNTLIPAELSGVTYHFPFSAITFTGASSSGGGIIETTYSGLVNSITAQTLSAGTFYLITDYRTCYDQPDYDNSKNAITSGIYKSANTVSPIVVLATSANTISIDAFQPEFPFDKIKYDYTFNATEHTGGPAFGRITERIDNFNNRTDYDHRTILFKRYIGYSYYQNEPLGGLVGISGITGNTGILYGNTGTTFNSNITSGSFIAIGSLTPRFFEVISVQSDFRATISGVTIAQTSNSNYYSAFDDGIMSYHQPNVRASEVYQYTTFGDAIADSLAVNNYIGDQANLYLENNTGEFLLANNVFLSGSFLNNRIGNGSYNNTFNDDCDSNQIGDGFYNNSTNDDFDGNIIGDFFDNNYITANFNNNRIGSDFDNNILIGGSFYRNNIGNDFTNNVWTNNDFQNNEIGNQFNNNNIYDDFYKNDIGNGYNGNNIYSNFIGNLIGNGYNGNTIYSQFVDNIIGDYFNSNTIGDSTNIGSVNFERNRIGYEFENNTILDSFSYNEVGGQFKGNLMMDEFGENDISSFVGGNQFSGGTYQNKIGPYTFDNDFLGLVDNNSWMGNFSNNNIGVDFSVNSFGSDISSNNIGNGFQYNEIGSSFNNNTIADNFGYGASTSQGNKIGNYFRDNEIGEYCYNNTISDNFHDNVVGNYFQWNIFNTNIDYTNFAINNGNITGFSYTASGDTAIDNIYNELSLCGTTTSIGIGATFDVEVSGGIVIGVTGATEGILYQNSDELTILGTQIGGTTPDDDIVITVTGTSADSLFYQHHTKQIFERRLGDKRVSFYDEDDILNVDSVYEISGYIPVYSQSLSFPIPNASFEFECDGNYTNNGGTTNQTANNTQELVTIFNSNFRSFGYFFDNNDGTLGLYINPSLKEQHCPSGVYTIYVFND